MTRYALVRPNDTVHLFASNVDPTVQTKAGWRWLVAPPASFPSYDPLTEKVTGPVHVVGAESVAESYTVVALNAGEITQAKDAAVEGGLQAGFPYPALFKCLLDFNNRLRALEGQSPASHNANQFKAAVKDLL